MRVQKKNITTNTYRLKIVNLVSDSFKPTINHPVTKAKHEFIRYKLQAESRYKNSEYSIRLTELSINRYNN